MMKMTKLAMLAAGMALLLAACSVELSETVTSPPEPQTQTPGPAAAATLPADPTAPPGGSDLHGRLFFLRFFPDGQALMSLDLESGEAKTVFKAAPAAWITGVAAIPSDDRVVLAYAPPPETGGAQSGFTDLSVLPMDGAGEPRPSLARTGEQQSFSSPIWSASSGYLFFTDYEAGESGVRYSVGRQAYPDGEREIIVENAIWPRVSPDGRWLVYIAFELGVGESGMFVLDFAGGGSAPQRVPLPDGFPIVDAPLFSPDGELIYFSAQSLDAPPPLSWLERLTGVQVAQAHNVPSDWWRVPVSGGEPERLTEIFQSGLYGAFSPDGEHLAFISSTGLHVMPADGGDVLTLIEAPDFYGSLDWIP